MAVSLHPRDLSLAQVTDALNALTNGAADFFDNDIAVLDLSQLTTQPAKIEWEKLSALLSRYNLHLAALRGVPEHLKDIAKSSGLAVLEHNAENQAIREKKPVEPTPPPAAAPNAASNSNSDHIVTDRALIVRTPVRAGQRIYATDRDLIITAVVNDGAEIIADGNIHVYAPLRGRALAGASGNKDARIFAMNMEPQLLSIAGVYRLFEDGFAPNWAGKVTQVHLDDNVLHIKPI